MLLLYKENYLNKEPEKAIEITILQNESSWSTKNETVQPGTGVLEYWKTRRMGKSTDKYQKRKDCGRKKILGTLHPWTCTQQKQSCRQKDDGYAVLTAALVLRCSLPPCGVSAATTVNLTTGCFSLSSVTCAAIWITPDTGSITNIAALSLLKEYRTAP